MVQLIRLLLEIQSSVLDGAQIDERIGAHLTEEQRDLAIGTSRRILRWSYLGVLIFLVIVPAAAGFLTYLLDELSAFDAAMRSVMLVVFFPITLMVGIYWGVAIGFLRAPRWLTDAALGDNWRRAIGAQTNQGARLACWALVFVGIAILLFMFYLSRAMAPFDK